MFVISDWTIEILDMDYVDSKCYWMINESTNL